MDDDDKHKSEQFIVPENQQEKTQSNQNSGEKLGQPINVTTTRMESAWERSQSEKLLIPNTEDLLNENVVKRDGLCIRIISAYAVGHLGNDLCAAAWFTYVLYFVKDVVMLDNVTAASVMLSGQIADGLATPLVGLFSDKFNTKIGKRMPWYIFGSLLVYPTFLGIFLNPQIDDHTLKIAYYLTLPALFNVGWASVQISNMAIVNSITLSTCRRDKLISLRNGFTYVAYIAVLACALIIFAVVKDQSWQFRILCFFILGLGICTSIYYMGRINEPKLTRQAKEYNDEFLRRNGQPTPVVNILRASKLSEHIKNWKDWIKEGQFYIYGLVYMLVRIAINTTMSIQPFYLIRVTKFEKTEDNPTPLPIALVPLLSYLSSLIFSLFFYKRMALFFRNRRTPLLIAVVVICFGSLPYAFITSDPKVRWLVYLVSSIQGIGLAIMINSSTSLISDVIGKNDQGSAFVYGAYSFFDKIANGLIIFGITSAWVENTQALKCVMSYIPVFAAIGAYGFAYLGNSLYENRLAKMSSMIDKINSKTRKQEEKLIEQQ